MNLAKYFDNISDHDEDTNDVTSNYHVLMMRMILMMKGDWVRRISGGQLGQLGGLELVPQLQPRNGDLIFSISSSLLQFVTIIIIFVDHLCYNSDLIFIFFDHLCYNSDLIFIIFDHLCYSLNTAGADGDDGSGDGCLSQQRSKSSPSSL